LLPQKADKPGRVQHCITLLVARLPWRVAAAIL
jgi:hypothetical protein